MASLYAGLNARRDGFGAGSPAGDGCLSDEVDTLTRISDPRPQVSTHTHTGCLKRSWLRGISTRCARPGESPPGHRDALTPAVRVGRVPDQSPNRRTFRATQTLC